MIPLAAINQLAAVYRGPNTVIVSPPETITWAIPLVSIVNGERLTTTLSGGYMHPAGLADARLLAPPLLACELSEERESG